MLIDPRCIETLVDKGCRNTTPAQACSTPTHENTTPEDMTGDKKAMAVLPEHFVTQGLVDLQINGFAGVDYNDPTATPEAIEASLHTMLKTGVTRCLPTVITADLDWQRRCFEALEAARQQSNLASAMIAGYHLEGPFLNSEPGYCGCHPVADMRAGDMRYFERVQAAANGQIRLITVAPEQPGVLEMIPKLVEQGVTVSIGHSAVDFDTLQQAVNAGASLSTHLGNGVAQTVTKSDNTVLSQLANDNLSASFIADGVHVKRHVLSIYLRAKTTTRTLLVTDGTAGSAALPGRYTLGKIAIERQQGPIVYIPGTTSLAGSAATLDDCVRNVVQWYNVSMQEAVRWASHQARLAIGLSEQPLAGENVEWVWWKMVDNAPRVVKVQLGEQTATAR